MYEYVSKKEYGPVRLELDQFIRGLTGGIILHHLSFYRRRCLIKYYFTDFRE